ncbi:MAG: PQQ-binding-like beta-propeller repeat protein, partial [Acidobacteriota bacterium]|nr:PQQ-binding-like beta-propeller repeat protein [Acidobacteriota bacterium]
DKWTLMRPNRLGGATWSGASFDPSLGYLFVNGNERAEMLRIAKQLEGAQLPYLRDNRSLSFATKDKVPCQRPPWGTLNAIDLSTGEIAWRVPLGFNEKLAKQGLTNTGTWSLGGTIATAGRLVFIAGTNDSRFRAFDSKTGKELWVTELPAPGHATPMTYRGKRGGKQFVVIAAGGGGNLGSKTSDALEAYSLP